MTKKDTKNQSEGVKSEIRPGIICIASNSKLPALQEDEELACDVWCELKNVEAIGIYREKLVNDSPSEGFFKRCEALRKTLEEAGVSTSASVTRAVKIRGFSKSKAVFVIVYQVTIRLA